MPKSRTAKKSDNPENFFWVKRVREEDLYYLVEVAPGTTPEEALAAFEKSEIAYGTDPDESKIHLDECGVSISKPTPEEMKNYHKGHIGHSLVEETRK